MAYDEGLASRLRAALAGEPGVVEQKMFGGLGMMVGGNMAVGVYRDGLLVRVDAAQREALLAEPGVVEFHMGAHTPKGFLVVRPQACAGDDELAAWVARGVGYARSLPPK
jgi:TfoX/Sxy family transcriptional regulator of competence genes